MPKFTQPLGKKGATRELIAALFEAKANGDTIIAAWVGRYKTDMFLIDDVYFVIENLLQKL